MLLGQNVLLQVARERKQFGLDGDVPVFADDKLGLASVPSMLTSHSALEKLLLRFQIWVVACSTSIQSSTLLTLRAVRVATWATGFLAGCPLS